VEVSGVEAACVAGVAATGMQAEPITQRCGAAGSFVDTSGAKARGKNGVTSTGIFSRTDVNATAADLISSTLLSQGFSLTRPPRGSADNLYCSCRVAELVHDVRQTRRWPFTAIGLPR